MLDDYSPATKCKTGRPCFPGNDICDGLEISLENPQLIRALDDSEELDSLDKETLIRLVLTQAETIAALIKQCETPLARVAELEAKLDLPPKTSDNSSTPAEQGTKTFGDNIKAKSDGKRKSHAGAHRRPQPNPTSSRYFRDACLPALRHRFFVTPATRLRSLRPYRNSSDQA